MVGLGEWVHNLTVPGKGKVMKFGLYTSRGDQQCDTPEYRERCMHTPPNPTAPNPTSGWTCEGSHGYEKRDAAWLVKVGADYVKVDSCGGDQAHSVAFSDYAKWRDAFNASAIAAGRKESVFFSVCGWKQWYGPPDAEATSKELPAGFGGGPSLGNSYRVHDDGNSWGSLSGCTNTIAAIGQWSQPGGWADPDLLIGPSDTHGEQSDAQARTQLNLWSVFPAPLLISQNVLIWSKFALETYSNTEVLAINQDAVQPGAKGGSGYKVGKRLAGSDLTLPCNASSSPQSCFNVWGRPLSDGKSFALAFVNNQGTNSTASMVECTHDCFVNLLSGAYPAANYTIRDLWMHEQVGTTSCSTNPGHCDGWSASVPGGGGSRMFKVTAVAEQRLSHLHTD